MEKARCLCGIRGYGMLHQTHLAVVRSFIGLAMLGRYTDGEKHDTSTEFPIVERTARVDDRVENFRGGIITVWPKRGLGCRYLRNLQNGSVNGPGYKVYAGMGVKNNRLFLAYAGWSRADPEYMSDVCGYGPTDTEQVALLNCLERTSREYSDRSVQKGLFIELRLHTTLR